MFRRRIEEGANRAPFVWLAILKTVSHCQTGAHDRVS